MMPPRAFADPGPTQTPGAPVIVVNELLDTAGNPLIIGTGDPIIV